MESSDTHAGHALSPNFGVRRLLRRGRLALVLGWFALWLGGIAQAACAVQLAPPRSSGNFVQICALGYAPAAQGPQDGSGGPDWQHLLHASTVPQPAMALAVCTNESPNFASPFAAQPLVVRADVRPAGDLLFDLRLPPDRPVYLRTLRLLI